MILDRKFWMCRRFRSTVSGRIFHEVWATGQRKDRLIGKAAAASILWPDASFVVRTATTRRALRAFGSRP